MSEKPLDGNLPWVDKYRPSHLKDIVGQSQVTKMLSQVLVNHNLPHLLFYGPAGTGKTSTILSIAKELFGPKIFRDRVEELNASDERGINVVRNKIITYARTTVGKKDPNYPCPPYKIIILDEADAMTTEAQSALRITIEKYSSVTRFCFICNYINQIMEPIASRCVKIRFRPINNVLMVDKLNSIAVSENLVIDNNSLDLLVKICKGDMRKGIMLLQNVKYVSNNITEDTIYDAANLIDNNKIDSLINQAIACKNIAEVIKLSKDIQCKGVPIHNLLIQLTESIINSNKFSEQDKCEISIYFSEVEKRLIDSAEESLQFLSVVTKINEVYWKN